jgi:phosphatidylserine/phosphatidylglycerophosphate/cardiolipin synthase-like enzyme
VSATRNTRHTVVRATLAATLLAVGLTGCKVGDLSSLASATPGDSSAVPPAGAAAGLITAPEQGYQPIYDFINSAKKSLDMTMYELTDTTAEQDLGQDAQRGVDVRVILDGHLEKSHNQTAFSYLSGHGVHVVWADPHYAATHQKTITIDGTTSAILTGNLTTQYYSTSRDFTVMDTTAGDVAAIEQTFGADFASTAITPPDGSDLVWSPTTAQPDLLAVINGAKTALQVENEEMGDSNVVDALTAAARRGVNVQVVMTRSSDWTDNFNALTSAGVHVATYSASAPLYIHAKVIIADAGQPTARMFLGSENFSTASLTRNRELGLLVGTPDIIAAVHTTLVNDYNGAQQWTS